MPMDGGGAAGLILDLNVYGVPAFEHNRWSQKYRLFLLVRLRHRRVVQFQLVERNFLRVFRDDQLQLARIFPFGRSCVGNAPRNHGEADYKSTHSRAVIVFRRVSGGFGIWRMKDGG